MSPLVVAWSMCGGACALIGVTQLLRWAREPAQRLYLLPALTSLAAAVVALVELAMMKSGDVARYGRLLQWENVAVFVLLVSLVWFVHVRLASPRRWLPALITLLWCVTLVVNFLYPHSIVFTRIERLVVHTAPWGESYALAVGELNPWVLVPNVAVLLILVHAVDAALRSARRGERQRAMLVGGAVVPFILLGGIQAYLVDAGLLPTPYMISFAYLAIVLALAYEMADSARQAAMLAQERAEALLEARRTREEFERLGRVSVLGELVTGIAHELNQPLAAILANAQAARRLLAAPEPDLAELRAILIDVVRDDKRAGDIIHRLRALLQKQPSHRETVCAAALVRETIDLMHAELQAHRIRLTLDAGDPAWTVEADRVGMQQVVLNLLSNAIRALESVPAEERELRIALSREDTALCMRVADRGPGIPEEVRVRLFDALYTSREGSLGMGLALCKRIVEAHGGSIAAVNRRRGGAAFRVHWPMASRDV